eukprot:gene17320-17511_t
MNVFHKSRFEDNIVPFFNSAQPSKAKTVNGVQRTVETLRDLGLSDNKIYDYMHRFTDKKVLTMPRSQMAVQTSSGQTEANGAKPSPLYPAPSLAIRASAVDKHADVCRSCPARTLGICGAQETEALAALHAIATTTHFAPHSSIFNQGDEANRVFIISKGIVRVSKSLSNGRRQVNSFAFPGDFIGLAPNNIHAVNADSIGEVVACQISRRQFSQMLDSNPALLKVLHSASLNELTTAQEQLASVGRHSAHERVATLLVNLRNRWRHIDNSSHYVALPMTRADIADYCGLSVESVSRTLAELARQKIIVIVPNGIRILNMPGIARLTQGVVSIS